MTEGYHGITHHSQSSISASHSPGLPEYHIFEHTILSTLEGGALPSRTTLSQISSFRIPSPCHLFSALIICSQELNLTGGVTYDESIMGNAYGFCHVLDM